MRSDSPLTDRPVDMDALATLPAVGLDALNAEITRQASMVAYIDDFRLMLLITLLCMPMLLLLRRPRNNGPADPAHAAID